MEVPKGYKGIVLSTTARPDHGGLEERRGGNSQVKAPLTPAPSVGSVSTSISEEAGSRRSTRTKGAGQVALSRPRTRLAPKKANTKQRIRLDSDEEDEDEDEKGVIQGVEDTSRGALRRTPSKRSRSESGIPAIVIQQPTPRKSRSALTSTSTEISISETLVDVEEGPEGEIDNGSKGDAIGIEPTMEDVVPSPATENDPPVFSITPRQSLTDVTNLTSPDGARDGDEDNPQEEDRAVRVLRPKAMFSEITLWTPDAPLAGFKADELLSRPTVEDEVKSEIVGEKTAVVVQSEVKEEDVKPGVKEEEAGTSLQKGWWRVGGAGEGGDDFVRAMGEWLGMVEMVSRLTIIDLKLMFSSTSLFISII